MPQKIKINLSFLQWINFYKFAIFLFALSFVFLDQFILLYYQKNTIYNKYAFLFTFIFLLTLSCYIYYLKNRNLIYKAFNISASNLSFKTAIKTTAKELFGRVEKINNNKATIKWSTFNNFEAITKTIKIEDIIYVTNYSYSKIFSKRKDREVFKLLTRNIQYTLNNQSPEEARVTREIENEEAFWSENEWTPKKTFKRFLIYSFLLPISFVCLYALYRLIVNPSFEILGFLPDVIGLLTISFLFFKSDLSILIQKRKRKKKKQIKKS